MKKDQIFDEVKVRKERNSRLMFYVMVLLIVGIVLLNVANYIVSYS